jgi:hypothetical protein
MVRISAVANVRQRVCCTTWPVERTAAVRQEEEDEEEESAAVRTPLLLLLLPLPSPPAVADCCDTFARLSNRQTSLSRASTHAPLGACVEVAAAAAAAEAEARA